MKFVFSRSFIVSLAIALGIYIAGNELGNYSNIGNFLAIGTGVIVLFILEVLLSFYSPAKRLRDSLNYLFQSRRISLINVFVIPVLNTILLLLLASYMDFKLLTVVLIAITFIVNYELFKKLDTASSVNDISHLKTGLIFDIYLLSIIFLMTFIISNEVYKDNIALDKASVIFFIFIVSILYIVNLKLELFTIKRTILVTQFALLISTAFSFILYKSALTSFELGLGAVIITASFYRLFISIPRSRINLVRVLKYLIFIAVIGLVFWIY